MGQEMARDVATQSWSSAGLLGGGLGNMEKHSEVATNKSKDHFTMCALNTRQSSVLYNVR